MATNTAHPIPINADSLRSAPKVLLHDHLDGGLRPATVIELAEAAGYRELPTTNAAELGKWFRDAADSGSLEAYLRTFAHTCGVMQTEEALFRVAAEAVEDLAADGVVYAEIRYAPELFQENGLSLEAAIDAIQAGFAEGRKRALARGQNIRTGGLLCAMRQQNRSMEIAELALRYRDSGVVGFDIAGPEKGFPCTLHRAAFGHLRQNNAHFTIHAGESSGIESIWEAIQLCGARRIGHGVRIIDDINVSANTGVKARLGRLASYVRDARIPLELCPSSNVQTGAVGSIADHPIGLLHKLHFRVTVNTDNRLMSGCSMSSEFAALAASHNFSWPDFQQVTVNAMKSAFIDFDERIELIDNVIKPQYVALGGGELAHS